MTLSDAKHPMIVVRTMGRLRSEIAQLFASGLSHPGIGQES